VSTTAATVLLEWECRSASDGSGPTPQPRLRGRPRRGYLGGLPVAGRLRRPRVAIGASASACSGGWSSPACDQARLRGTSLRTARPQHQPHFTQGARPSTGCAPDDALGSGCDARR
jgi:hypothetical protein